MYNDLFVAKWIYDSICRTKEIAQRDHIQAIRSERVGLFVTSLRSLSNVMGKYNLPQIWEKELWHDIGVLSAGFENTRSARQYNSEALLRWVRLSNSFASQEIARTLSNEVKDLEIEVAGCRINNQQAERINQEAQLISDKLVEVLGT